MPTLVRRSVNHFMVPRLTFTELTTRTSAAGWNGIGVWLAAAEELGPEAVRSQLARTGLEATSLCVALGLTGADADERSARLAGARRALELAARLDAPLVVIADGLRPGGERAAVTAEFVDQLGRLSDTAGRIGARLLLEPLHPAMIGLSVLTSLRAATVVAAAVERVGLVLDVWHVWAETDLTATIVEHADRIEIVHLADWAAGPFTEDRALPGAGLAGTADLIAAVRRSGADVWWELEVLTSQARTAPAQRRLLSASIEAAEAVLLTDTYREESNRCAS